MVEQYAGALLYLVPVAVAAVVAFVVTRPGPADEPPANAAPPVRSGRPIRSVRAVRSVPVRPAPTPRPHPTLLHAALSAHLDAVARSVPANAPMTTHAARLVSIRRPTPIPRRPSHRCPLEQ